jgi:probable rRNA maturation factor
MVKVLITSDTRYKADRKAIRKAVVDSFKRHNISDIDAEVSILVVGARKMTDLTKKYLGDMQKHEVLSFALEEVGQDMARGFINSPDGVLRLGDIILCWPQVLEGASKRDVMVNDEVYKITSHGVDHLLGQHHE